MRMAEVLLEDLSQFKLFRQNGMELLEEMKNYRREQFDTWSHDLMQAIDDASDPIG